LLKLARTLSRAEQGLRIETKLYNFDVIILAIGLDAGSRSLKAAKIGGENGANLNEKWSQSLESHLGIMVEGFANMFMVPGPQSPFANIPVVIDGAVTWTGKAIEHLRHTERSKIAATKASSHKWATHVNDVFQMTVLVSAASRSAHGMLGRTFLGSRIVSCFLSGSGGLFQHNRRGGG
jgi:cyclohexanone monooxygenase